MDQTAWTAASEPIHPEITYRRTDFITLGTNDTTGVSSLISLQTLRGESNGTQRPSLARSQIDTGGERVEERAGVVGRVGDCDGILWMLFMEAWKLQRDLLRSLQRVTVRPGAANMKAEVGKS
jgi:hypothetical protein